MKHIKLPIDVVFGIFVLLTLSVFMASVILPVSTQAGVGGAAMNFSVINTAPTVGTVTCDHTVGSPSEATNFVAWCYAVITDLNGYQDVVACNGTFFRTSSGKAGTADDNIRYSNASCQLIGGSSNTVNCNCSFGMKYFADGGVSWTGNISTRDGTAVVAHNEGVIAGATLDALISIDLTSNKSQWGTLVVGTNTTFNTGNFTVVNNTGNVNVTIKVQAVDQLGQACDYMICIPSPANLTLGGTESGIRYSLAVGGAWSTGTVLTSSLVEIAGDWMDNRQAATPGKGENRSTYWAIGVPLGVNGTCTVIVNNFALGGSIN